MRFAILTYRVHGAIIKAQTREPQDLTAREAGWEILKMKYNHKIEYNGDAIMKTLLVLRNEYGDRWTDNMASYAIGKSRKIKAIKYREPLTA